MFTEKSLLFTRQFDERHSPSPSLDAEIGGLRVVVGDLQQVYLETGEWDNQQADFHIF